MAKVLLIAPPYLDLYGKLEKAAGRYFPLGLGYIASYIMKYGYHDVRLLEPEAQKLSYDDLERIVQEYRPDVVGLTCATPNFSRALTLAKIARENSTAKIVLGGVHASAIPEFIIGAYSENIDCVVVGEGEKTFLELIAAFENNSDLGKIYGIVFRKDGITVRTPPQPFIENLDSIPFPARELVPQDLFHPNLHNARHKRCLSILTSRGCPYNCTFCASRIISGRKYRVHSAEYVLEEMDLLKRAYNAKQLLITDDTFTIDHTRLEKICRGMIDRRMNLEWFCFSQINVVNREILSLMKRAGCYNIGFGIESGDESILRKMGKPIKPDDAITTVRIANELGLKTQAFYVLGMPGETKEQMEHTIQFADRVNATLAFFNMLVPYPGTRDFNHFFSGVSLDKIEWEDFVAIGEACVLKNSLVPAIEIERMIARANRNYYLKIGRLFRLLLQIRTPYELVNYLKGGVSLLKQISQWVKITSISEHTKISSS